MILIQSKNVDLSHTKKNGAASLNMGFSLPLFHSNSYQWWLDISSLKGMPFDSIALLQMGSNVKNDKAKWGISDVGKFESAAMIGMLIAKGWLLAASGRAEWNDIAYGQEYLVKSTKKGGINVFNMIEMWRRIVIVVLQADSEKNGFSTLTEILSVARKISRRRDHAALIRRLKKWGLDPFFSTAISFARSTFLLFGHTFAPKLVGKASDLWFAS